LNDAVEGADVDLPDPKSILPFLDLYTLVVLLPDELDRFQLVTHHLPELSVLHGSQFIPAPAETLPDGPGVARIFDVLALSDTLPEKFFGIPLSPHHTEYTHQRYWRLPARPEVVLTMLMERIRHVTGPSCEEIKHARVIYGILLINITGVDITLRLPGGGKRTSDEAHDEEPPYKQSRGGAGDDSAVSKGKANKAKGKPALKAKQVQKCAKIWSPRRPRRIRLKI
jgi:hypothetical protein